MFLKTTGIENVKVCIAESHVHVHVHLRYMRSSIATVYYNNYACMHSRLDPWKNFKDRNDQPLFYQLYANYMYNNVHVHVTCFLFRFVATLMSLLLIYITILVFLVIQNASMYPLVEHRPY